MTVNCRWWYSNSCKFNRKICQTTDPGTIKGEDRSTRSDLVSSRSYVGTEYRNMNEDNYFTTKIVLIIVNAIRHVYTVRRHDFILLP